MIRRLSSRAGCAVLAAALLALAGFAPAHAAYPVLAPGYHQRDWLSTTSAGEIEGSHTILPDGSLLLPVEIRPGSYELRRFDPTDTRLGDGQLFARVGHVADIKSLDGSIFFVQGYDETWSYHRLLKIDPRTRSVSEVFRWQFLFDIVVDPVTKGFVLFDCPESVDCFTTKGGSDDSQRVVALDPATGRKTELVPDTRRPIGSQYSFSLSPDGGQVFVARKEFGIDVYERVTGRLLTVIPTSAFVARLRYGPGQGCFANRIVYRLDDGSVWTVDPKAPGTPSQLIAATGEPLQFNGKEITFDLEGRLVSSEGSLLDGHVTVIDCKPIPPFRNPKPAANQPPPQQRPTQPDGTLTSGGRPDVPGSAPGAAPGPAAPPGSAQTATATQPVSQPAQAGSFGQAMQAASAPQPGLADAPEDTPQLGFSARARRPDPPTPAAVWVAALLLATAAAVHRRLDHPDVGQQQRRATP